MVKRSAWVAICILWFTGCMMQVEELTRKAQLQELELERTTKQLKEAIAVADEETAKCTAAKEVIKSPTAQVS